MSCYLVKLEKVIIPPDWLAWLIGFYNACRIAELETTDSFMWLGAGETDLKVGFHVQKFVDAYRPVIVDCTYDT